MFNEFKSMFSGFISHKRNRWASFGALAVVAMILSGTFILRGGSEIRAQQAAADPASINISPVEAYNPIKTQHTLVAQVKDAAGTPVSGARVEWILNRAPGLVGDIVCACGGAEQIKVDNTYAIVKVGSNGESGLTITATREGDTDITAYAPGIKDQAVHKVFAVKHWVDLTARFPGDAVNPVGTKHVMTVRTVKVSNGSPVAAVPVRFTIVGDTPSAFLGVAAPGAKTVIVNTDLNGFASMTLQQVSPAQGTNTVRMDVLVPVDNRFILLSKQITKQWQASILGLTKTGPVQVGIGQDLTYTMVAKNSGDVAATGVTLVDTIPQGMSYVSSNASGAQVGKQVTWTVGTLDPGATRTFTLVLRADSVGTWTNRARATASTGAAADAEATTLVVAPVMRIEKAGPGQAVSGAEFSYNMVVRNLGNGTATGVTVRDTLPAGLTFVSADPTASVAGNVITWNAGSLATGASTTFAMTVKGNQAGTFENVVVVTSAEGSTDTARASTTILAPAVSITKTGPSAIPSGFTRPYTLSVTNTGATPLSDVTITDELPSGLSYQSSTLAGTASAGRVTWNVGNLAVLQRKDVSVVLKGEAAGIWTNVATVSTAEGASARATLVVTVVAAPPGATMSLLDTLDPIAVGELETYTIVVDNQAAAQDLHNMTIVAVIPSQMSFVGATGPTAFTVVGNEVRFGTVATVTPAQKLTFVVTVRANIAGSVLFTSTMRYDEFPPGPILVQEATTIFRP